MATTVDWSDERIAALSDQDLKNLNEMERKYHERLPRLADRPELASPIKRISARKYKASQRAGRATT